jgi:hypothetical protein
MELLGSLGCIALQLFVLRLNPADAPAAVRDQRGQYHAACRNQAGEKD